MTTSTFASLEQQKCSAAARRLDHKFEPRGPFEFGRKVTEQRGIVNAGRRRDSNARRCCLSAGGNRQQAILPRTPAASIERAVVLQAVA